ncbi:MAG: hypothetical protein IJ561_03310 [Ruminococcus sp.]|nr:hypothetical protein [Ruminococcus sp.]
MKIRKAITAFLGSLLIFVSSAGFTALAETPLPDGAVKGLPERLAALDDEGNAVNSETGEYFFRVEGMKYGETYTKNVQLMNLREDKSYHIYFYVEPLFKSGEIDLEKGCECRFYLDGENIYTGTVTGDGNIDLTQQHFDCGFYAPGDTHTLRCEVIWDDLDVLSNVDNGHRLIDKEGEHVLVGPDDSGYVEGEIEFKWIFYAQVQDETPDDSSKGSKGGSDISASPITGVLKSPVLWISLLALALAMVGYMLMLVKKKQHRQDDER